jgi:CheY-like chemotaxis protein
MPDGGILSIKLDRIRVSAKGRRRKPYPVKLEAGDWVQLIIADTGTGIPADILPQVFDPFFTTKAQGRGSGLGLAQVHGIITQHGGHIGVHSQTQSASEQGTVFTIYLPAVQDSLGVMDPESVDVSQKGGGDLILVVEDQDVLRDGLVETLSALNYRVVAAANGLEALDLLTQQEIQPDLVLSDVVMPKMGGITLFDELTRRVPGLPVVLISGYPQGDEWSALSDRGLAAWLNKPLSATTLAQTLSDVLRSRSR